MTQGDAALNSLHSNVLYCAALFCISLNCIVATTWWPPLDHFDKYWSLNTKKKKNTYCLWKDFLGNLFHANINISWEKIDILNFCCWFFLKFNVTHISKHFWLSCNSDLIHYTKWTALLSAALDRVAAINFFQNKDITFLHSVINLTVLYSSRDESQRHGLVLFENIINSTVQWTQLSGAIYQLKPWKLTKRSLH